MSLWTLSLTLSGFWIAISLVHRLLKPSTSLLPTPFLPPSCSYRLWNASTTKVVLTTLHLRIQTSAWNLKHDSLASSIARRKNVHVKTSLTYFYNAGCAVGVMGMIGALGILLWTCGQTGFSLVDKLYDLRPPPNATPVLIKRELEADSKSYTSHNHFLTPIIPGVTVPLAHLPSILVAVFIGQIIHEAGHGICAALESVPILSTGASFIVFIPSAFVTLSTASLESVKPLAHLRIIAAGPFHNLVFWCLLVAAGKTGIGHAFWSVTGYRDISSSGRIVIAVDQDSALHRHLSSGTLITALDDTVLGKSPSEPDKWTSYLIGPKQPREINSAGWCVDAAMYLLSSQICCDIGGSSSLSCFKSLAEPSELRCLDAVLVLTQPESIRCTSVMGCAGGSLCVHPHNDEQLLRMTIQHLSESKANQDVILWRGPKREVWEEVQVGKLLPRFAFLPLWLPLAIQSFVQYLGMATLSLYLFNLLPLPLLDGAQLLVVVFDLMFKIDPSVDHETLESGIPVSRRQRDHTQWKYASRSVILFTTAVFGLCVTFMLLNLI